MACLVMSLLHIDGSDDGFRRDRQVPDADAERAMNGVRDRGRRRALRGLAGTERPRFAVDEMDVDARRRGEAQDRVALPVVAGDPPPVEPHPLDGGPARGLDGASGELVASAVGVDHQAEVRGNGQSAYPKVALGLDL